MPTQNLPPHSTAPESAQRPVLRLFRGTLAKPLTRWAAGSGDSSSTTEKRQLIDEIRLINSTATPRFLRQFDSKALRQYLQHLHEAQDRHREEDEAEAMRIGA